MSTEIFIWILYSKRDRVRIVERGLMADEGKEEEEEAEKKKKMEDETLRKTRMRRERKKR